MGSPAVDAGSNLAGLSFDQRGDGFPRVVGAQADIGAFEGTVAVVVPTVTSIDPTLGPVAGGTTVTIIGTGFTGAKEVYFGGTAALFTIDSDTQITATSPAGTGTVDVTVATDAGTSAASAADQFTYLVPALTVTAVDPTTGPTLGGTTVTITGTNLDGATAVMFGSALGHDSE